MKNMITMTGKSFRGEMQALQDFTNKQSHYVNTDKVLMVVNKGKMSADCYSTNGYMIGKFVVSYTDIERKEDISFFVNVPPLMPCSDEVVKIIIEDNTTIVEYVKSGYMFRTTVESTSHFDHESYLKGMITKPAFRIAVNAKYLKRILLSLIKSSDTVSRDRAPVFMDFAGEEQPIRIFVDEGNQRVLYPMKNHQLPSELHLSQMLSHVNPEPTLHKSGSSSREEYCPNCRHELNFLRSRLTDLKDIKACPYCGKAIIIRDNESVRKI